jgi:hypothetical protein
MADASTFDDASNREIPSTMPADTPASASWVVATLTRATSSRVAASMATTSVNVPPTSMPSRSLGTLLALERYLELDGEHYGDRVAVVAARDVERQAQTTYEKQPPAGFLRWIRSSVRPGDGKRWASIVKGQDHRSERSGSDGNFNGTGRMAHDIRRKFSEYQLGRGKIGPFFTTRAKIVREGTASCDGC